MSKGNTFIGESFESAINMLFWALQVNARDRISVQLTCSFKANYSESIQYEPIEFMHGELPGHIHKNLSG